MFNQSGNVPAPRQILHPFRGKAHPPCGPVQQQHNLFMGDIVAAWSDDRVFRNGHWIFDDAPDELRTVHYVAGSSMPSAKAASSIMDRVRTDPPRS